METVEFEDNVNKDDDKDLELALLEIINNDGNRNDNTYTIAKARILNIGNKSNKCKPCIRRVEWIIFYLMLLGGILSLPTVVMMFFGAQGFYYSKHLVETNYTITRHETTKHYCPGYNIPDNVIIGYDNDSDYYYHYNSNYNNYNYDGYVGDDDGRYYTVPWTTFIYGQWIVPGENPSSSTV